jgi:hypothetical protein
MGWPLVDRVVHMDRNQTGRLSPWSLTPTSSNRSSHLGSIGNEVRRSRFDAPQEIDKDSLSSQDHQILSNSTPGRKRLRRARLEKENWSWPGCSTARVMGRRPCGASHRCWSQRAPDACIAGRAPLPAARTDWLAGLSVGPTPAGQRLGAPPGPWVQPVPWARRRVPSGRRPVPWARRRAPSGRRPVPWARRRAPSGRRPA